MSREKNLEKNNSFYKYGNEDILEIEQDEKSLLWKIKFITGEHYVVSREFNRSVGMYGNAPDSVILVGLMEFSESLIGDEMSIYDVMDRFIDRCFDDGVFDRYTTNALWMSLDFLHYEEMEDILNTYCNRIVWPVGDEHDTIRDIMLKYSPKNGVQTDTYCRDFRDIIGRNKIEAIFCKKDKTIEGFMSEKSNRNVPCFIANYKQNGEFTGFTYVPRDN